MSTGWLPVSERIQAIREKIAEARKFIPAPKTIGGGFTQQYNTALESLADAIDLLLTELEPHLTSTTRHLY